MEAMPESGPRGSVFQLRIPEANDQSRRQSRRDSKQKVLLCWSDTARKVKVLEFLQGLMNEEVLSLLSAHYRVDAAKTYSLFVTEEDFGAT